MTVILFWTVWRSYTSRTFTKTIVNTSCAYRSFSSYAHRLSSNSSEPFIFHLIDYMSTGSPSVTIIWVATIKRVCTSYDTTNRRIGRCSIMSTNLIVVYPRNRYFVKKWWELIEDKDVHKWIIGFEKGKNGYRHCQCRLRLSMAETDAFTTVKDYIPIAHIEKCSDTWEYERKEGRFLSSEDTPEIRKVRFGKPRWYQKQMMQNVMNQGDRGITVWYNPSGCIGKSWLCNWLWETGQAYIVNVTDNVKSMVQDVASEYMEHGFRKILVLDMPRGWKWNNDTYVAVERIKDGLIKDVRYHSRTINIRGVCILILCNNKPDTSKLSDDRWDIYEDYYV